MLGEHQHVARLDPARETRRGLFAACLRFSGVHGQGKESQFAKFGQRRATVARRQGAVDQFARARLGFVLKCRHTSLRY